MHKRTCTCTYTHSASASAEHTRLHTRHRRACTSTSACTCTFTCTISNTTAKGKNEVHTRERSTRDGPRYSRHPCVSSPYAPRMLPRARTPPCQRTGVSVSVGCVIYGPWIRGGHAGGTPCRGHALPCQRQRPLPFPSPPLPRQKWQPRPLCHSPTLGPLPLPWRLGPRRPLLGPSSALPSALPAALPAAPTATARLVRCPPCSLHCAPCTALPALPHARPWAQQARGMAGTRPVEAVEAPRGVAVPLASPTEVPQNARRCGIYFHSRAPSLPRCPGARHAARAARAGHGPAHTIPREARSATPAVQQHRAHAAQPCVRRTRQCPAARCPLPAVPFSQRNHVGLHCLPPSLHFSGPACPASPHARCGAVSCQSQ